MDREFSSRSVAKQKEAWLFSCTFVVGLTVITRACGLLHVVASQMKAGALIFSAAALALLVGSGCFADPDVEASDGLPLPGRGEPAPAPPAPLNPISDVPATVPGPPPTAVDVSVIYDQHRAVPGAMFGGWGPHLGHLLRRANGATDETWFADDACIRNVSCNVNQNIRVDLHRRDRGKRDWQRVDEIFLPIGVQQNTGALLAGDRILVYGINVITHRVTECFKNLLNGAKGCVDLPGDIGAGSNYVGAAISPRGFRMAWYTKVVDGGGGSFSFFADYGGGWNGPRTGAIGGYNDASYVNIAFGANGNPDQFLMHGQLVSGKAPAWSFVGAAGTGDISSASSVAWTTPFMAAANASVQSTNDVAIDPVTGDTHLVARLSNGDAAYYFAPKGSQDFQGPIQVFAKSFRARLTFLGSGDLVLARSVKGKGLSVQIAPKAGRTAGRPVTWNTLPEIVPALPAGYEDLLAIYSQSSVYQTAPVAAVELALVGSARENEVAYVRIDP
jgi:hypothetical protein